MYIATIYSSILFLLIAAFHLHIPTATHANTKDEGTITMVTTNHTIYLSIRCFSFDDNFVVTHLLAGGQYKFRMRKRLIYPSSTMFICSTDTGNFVTYNYNYECAKQYKTCGWRFSEDSAYKWGPKQERWYAYDYAPDYESLN